MFNIAICDDNITFINYEEKLIESYMSCHNVDYECDKYLSGDELLSIGDEINKYNLIILDYQMDGLTGFETASKIYEIAPDSAIAFATVFYDFTRQGYKYRAVRYLVKQEDSFEEDLYECIEHILGRELCEKSVVLHLYDSVRKVDIDDIVFIKSDDHYVKYCIKGLNTDTDHLIKRSSLDEVCKELPDRFVRVHQRYVVNLKNAMRIYNGKIEMATSEGEIVSLPIARSKADQVYRQFCLLKGEIK